MTCTQLPLAEFGRAVFADTSTTAGTHTGTIKDPGWKAQAQDATPRRKERSSRDVVVRQRNVIQRPPFALTGRKHGC
jgi:hypothetical protein